MADVSSCPGMTIFRLRVVIAGISPLIWRRLEVAADTTVAGLHAIVQTVFGWSGEHLHRFVIGGTEYGISYPGGPGFRDDARQVRLADLRLRESERFVYEYNFSAAWRVDLRVEQIARAQPGRAYPRCTGGRQAGPPEDWDGPWAFLERTQPHLVFGATIRAAEIIGQLLDACDHENLADVGVDREELAELAPLLGLERFDRRACNHVLRGLAAGVHAVAERSQG
jgi:Plasmid pRiA4b ORF-3-like protein